MRPSSPSEIFFCQIPNLQELCSVLVRFPAAVASSNSQDQASQVHVLKCREFIFTEPDIIATPLFKEKTIQLIMQLDKPKRVMPVDFQFCFKYTLLAKIAPLWNKVAEYLVQERDFLTMQKRFNAITFDLSVNENESYLVLKPKILSLPNMDLIDLGIPSGIVAEFKSHRHEMRIAEHSIQNQWCHILPSMKKGKIVNISHTLPSNSPFKFYKDVKKYWKNTYGYRLPESDENIFYVQVYFKPIGDILFTYPSVCIRRCDPVLFPRPDSQSILEAFFSDLHARMPTLCGAKFSCSCKAQFTEMSALTAAETNSAQRQNLSSQNPNLFPSITNRAMEWKSSKNLPEASTQSAWKCSQAVVTKLKPVFKPMMKPKSITNITHDENVPKTIPMFKALHPRAPKNADEFPQNVDLLKSFPSAAVSAATKPPMQPRIISFVKSIPKPEISTQPKASKMPVKRPAQITGDEKVKKVKTKPKIMDSANVEQLARANQLVKVNAATLQCWLKERGATCKSKEKKGDLINRVYAVLNITPLK